MVDRRSSRSPVKIGVGGALLGAIVTFLISAQLEGVKQDGKLLSAVSAVTEQTAEILRNQREIREELLNQRRWMTRLDDMQAQLRQRLDRLEDKQSDLAQGAVKLRADVQAWMRFPVVLREEGPDTRLSGYESLAEIAREIVELEKEGSGDVWTKKGRPYARVDVLSARLARSITAQERDTAAALIEVSRIGSSDSK